MSTTPLTDSINALTTYANEVTGASDTTLSDAVYTLAQGYGQGGGNIETGTITLTENQSEITLNLNLSFTPKVVALRLREMTSDVTTYKTFFCIYVYGTTTGVNNYLSLDYYYITQDGYYGGTGRVSYGIITTMTASEIVLPARSSTISWATGTYDYIIVG